VMLVPSSVISTQSAKPRTTRSLVQEMQKTLAKSPS
jgi:hypothetical protein